MKQILVFLAIGIFVILPSLVSAQAAGNLQIKTRDCWAEVDLVPVNKSDLRLTIFTPPFEGLSLKGDQVSATTQKVCTGEYLLAGRYDREVDSLSSGRKYDYFVYDKIIVEGQDSLFFTDYDLQQVGRGVQIKKIIRNNDNDQYAVIGGNNDGEVIPAESPGKKLTLNKGWNVLAIQYLDSKSLPTQAIVLFMANDDKIPLVIEKGVAAKTRYNPDGIGIRAWKEKK